MAKYRKYSTRKCWLTPKRKASMNTVKDSYGYMMLPPSRKDEK